jgi:hypothetical protein
MKENLNYIQLQISKKLSYLYDELKVPEKKRLLVSIIDNEQDNYDIAFIKEESDSLDMSNRVCFRNETKKDLDANIEKQLKSAISVLL